MARKDRTDIAVPLVRRNYVLSIINGGLCVAGMRSADPSTIEPLLVLRLTGAEWAIGLLAACSQLARVGTQLISSRILDAQERKRPWYIFWSVVRVIALIAATMSLLTGVGRNPWLVLGILLAAVFVRMVGNGIAELVWSDITARSVPSDRRGTLMTGRRVLGLALSLVIVAPLVAHLLSDDSAYAFPANYGMLYLMVTVFSTLGWATFSFVREPAAHAARRRLTWRQHFLRGVRIYGRDATYRRLLRLRFVQGVSRAIPIFFIAFAKVGLGLPDRSAAVFLTLSLVSEIVGSVVMGRISDRRGNRAVIVIATGISFCTFIAATLSALTVASGAGQPGDNNLGIALLGLAFIGLGLLTSSRDMGEFNYMLDIAPAMKRQSYIGFGNAFLLPLIIVPILAGWLAPRVGYLLLFGAAAIVAALAIFAAVRLDEPRRKFREEAEGAD
jgi:MFS family permease